MPSQAPVLTELLVAQGLWALWLMPLFLAFGQPPIPTRCLTAFQTSTVTQPLSRNHTPRETYQPPFQDPLPLYSFLFSLILHQCRHLFLRQLPAQLYQSGELGQALGLPLYPEVLVPATYPGCGTSPRYLPEPLGLGSTLSFLSWPLNSQPMCTQGYSRSAMSKTLSLRLGSTRMKQVSSSLAVLTWSLDGLAWEAGGRLRSGRPAQRRFWTFWWQGRPRGWRLGGKEKGVCGSGFSWLRRY